MSALPSHGRISCRLCFNDSDVVALPHPKWRMSNDPGAWGSPDPEWLVLGFSKGSTQADIYGTGRFEDVAFAGMRDRLTRTLRHFEILERTEDVGTSIADPNGRIAFGSLIRCSVSRREGSDAESRYSCTGPIIKKAFTEIPHVLRRCGDRFLTRLPMSLKAVLVLGNGDAYVDACQALIRDLYPNDFARVNPVAARAGGVLWVHLSHPSGLNGHFESWLTGGRDSGGGKRIWAEEALQQVRA